MFNISQFFGRVKSIQVKNELIKSVIQKALQEHAKIDVTAGAISFKSSTVVLKGLSQAARAEIFIKKPGIIASINAAQELRRISDIQCR